MTTIPSAVSEPAQKDELIPQEVAELPQDGDDPEAIPYVISFEKYNGKVCEIRQLSSNKGRKAIEVLKDIGTKVRSTADFYRHSIDRLPIKRAGDYLKLFKGLKDDIDLYEIKLQDAARIFYFDIESQRLLYVVAITENHLETDKQRKR